MKARRLKREKEKEKKKDDGSKGKNSMEKDLETGENESFESEKVITDRKVQ